MTDQKDPAGATTATATRPVPTARPSTRTGAPSVSLSAPSTGLSVTPSTPTDAGGAARTSAPLVPTRDDFTFTAPPAHVRTAPAASSSPTRTASLGLVWMSTATAIAVLSGFFVLIISGRVFTEGPVVLVLSRTHGIHLGDLFALGAWCLATVGLLASAVAGTPLRRR